MSWKVKTVSVIGLIVAAVFVSGSALAYHPEINKGALNRITGEITAVDPAHGTVWLKSDGAGMEGRDLVVRLDDSTRLVGCKTADISHLRVGDRVTVAFYELNDRFFADTISPSGFYSHMRC